VGGIPTITASGLDPGQRVGLDIDGKRISTLNVSGDGGFVTGAGPKAVGTHSLVVKATSGGQTLATGSYEVTAAQPEPTEGAFYLSVLLVQNETGAGYRRTAESPGFVGQHYSAFGPDCKEPTGAASRFKQVTGVRKMLFAAIAPADLDKNGQGCAGSNSRLKDTPEVEEFAGRINDVISGDADISHVNFWNELKGYYGLSGAPGGWDAPRFCRDYITFADIIRDVQGNTVAIGGPYSTGGASQDQRHYIHTEFIDRVVIPHPDLVDFICWDHNDGSTHRWYTDLYEARGIDLPHWNVEWYPGGHGSGTAPSVQTMVNQAMEQATNPRMAGCFIWGSGTDNNQKVDLWTGSNATPTPYWTAYVMTAEFAEKGGVTRVSANVYRNAAGQTLTVGQNSVSVT
jgi:hypothetical protein